MNERIHTAIDRCFIDDVGLGDLDYAQSQVPNRRLNFDPPLLPIAAVAQPAGGAA